MLCFHDSLQIQKLHSSKNYNFIFVSLFLAWLLLLLVHCECWDFFSCVLCCVRLSSVCVVRRKNAANTKTGERAIGDNQPTTQYVENSKWFRKLICVWPFPLAAAFACMAWHISYSFRSVHVSHSGECVMCALMISISDFVIKARAERWAKRRERSLTHPTSSVRIIMLLQKHYDYCDHSSYYQNI